MSQLEISQHSPTVHTFQFIAMLAGEISNLFAIPNFNGSTSKIIGIRRVVVGGTVGQPYATISTGLGLATHPVIILKSSNAADTSVYAIYWTNQVAYSPNQTILPC